MLYSNPGIAVAFTPTLTTGWGTPPPTNLGSYSVDGNMCTVFVWQAGAAVSNSTSTVIALPIVAATVTGMQWNSSIAQINDNGTAPASPGLATVASAATSVTIFKDAAGTGWTASGVKLIRGSFTYQI